MNIMDSQIRQIWMYVGGENGWCLVMVEEFFFLRQMEPFFSAIMSNRPNNCDHHLSCLFHSGFFDWYPRFWLFIVLCAWTWSNTAVMWSHVRSNQSWYPSCWQHSHAGYYFMQNMNHAVFWNSYYVRWFY